MGAATSPVLGRHEVIADPEGEGEDTPNLDVVLVDTERAEERPHVVHSSVVDVAKSIGDLGIMSGPVVDRQVNGHSVVGGQGEESPKLRSGVASLGVDLLDDLIEQAPFPLVEDLVQQGAAIFEVPVEAALGDTELAGDRLDADAVGAGGSKRAQALVDPATPTGV